jgi:hypothetical protein
MAPALGPFIQEAHTVVSQKHPARQRHLPPTDQPDIGEGVVRGPKRAGGDDGGAIAGELATR